MDAENVSARLASCTPGVTPAIEALLLRVPEAWADYQPNTLTAAEETALFLLVAAGRLSAVAASGSA